MDLLSICRICLIKPSSDLISIYSHVFKHDDLSQSNQNNTQIAHIIDELTGNQYNAADHPYPDKICELCYRDVTTVFEFRQKCKTACEQLLKLSESNILVEEPNIDILLDTKPFPVEPSDVPIIQPQRIIHPVVEATEIVVKTNDSIEKPSEPDEIIKDEIVSKAATTQPASKCYECDICKKTFTRHNHLKRHMTIHSDERAYSCKICDKKFRRADHLKIHENYHANLKPYTCTHCQKTFSRNEHLKRHISNIHTQNKSTFDCDSCDFIAESAKDLRNHRKTDHRINEFSCKSCDKKFDNKTALRDHIKTHNKSFLCSECGMRFIRNDYLVVHMRRHTGERPYKCRFCERAFPRATDLTVHERYHTNEKHHTCNLCGKGFQRAYNLTVHMRVHTGEKPYQCHHCTRSFSQGNDLKAHIRRHTGERYQCEFCEASFIQVYLLNNHKKLNHGIEAKSNISRVAKFEESIERAVH